MSISVEAAGLEHHHDATRIHTIHDDDDDEIYPMTRFDLQNDAGVKMGGHAHVYVQSYNNTDVSGGGGIDSGEDEGGMARAHSSSGSQERIIMEEVGIMKTTDITVQ